MQWAMQGNYSMSWLVWAAVTTQWKHWNCYITSAGFRHIEASRRLNFIWSLCPTTRLDSFVLCERQLVCNNIIVLTIVTGLFEIRWNKFVCIEKEWDYAIRLADSVTCFVDLFLPFMDACQVITACRQAVWIRLILRHFKSNCIKALESDLAGASLWC